MTVINIASGAIGMTSNAYLILGEEPALVDAGASFDAVAAIDTHLDEPLTRVVLTHTHPDHVGNLQAVSQTSETPVFGYDSDSEYVDTVLTEGDTITLGNHRYEAWFTPGHAPDHLCLYSDTASTLFSGDLIFPNGGVGRTDLPGANHDELVESIRTVRERTDQSLQSLYAGHGQEIDADAYRHIEAAAEFVGL